VNAILFSPPDSDVRISVVYSGARWLNEHSGSGALSAVGGRVAAHVEVDIWAVGLQVPLSWRVGMVEGEFVDSDVALKHVVDVVGASTEDLDFRSGIVLPLLDGYLGCWDELFAEQSFRLGPLGSRSGIRWLESRTAFSLVLIMI